MSRIPTMLQEDTGYLMETAMELLRAVPDKRKFMVAVVMMSKKESAKANQTDPLDTMYFACLAIGIGMVMSKLVIDGELKEDKAQ